MPHAAHAYAAFDAKKPLGPFQLQRRDPTETDVAIDIQFCGVCHSDLHTARAEWGTPNYPIVPGHEIVGKVAKVGSKVSRFKVGDTVGVGCLVNSCRECGSCKAGLEQYCERGNVQTYGGKDRDGSMTQGGYSTHVVVDQDFVLKIPAGMALDAAAPLLCAGITTYSPLKHWNVGKGQKVAILGLGGLGHMGVKIAVAMGAEVSLLSHSPAKRDDAKRLGAHEFLLTSDEKALKASSGRFDFILDTVSAHHELGTYAGLLARDGKLVLVGAPEKPLAIHAFNIIPKRRTIAASLIGGIQETQEMLDFCASHKIVADVETIKAAQINDAYERMLAGQVRYRFVIDSATLR
jgi:uncharacterized zinc-type alcohol dehydrogenase-like protein